MDQPTNHEPIHPTPRKYDDANYWKSRYLTTAHKLHRQSARYKEIADTLSWKAKNFKHLTPTEVAHNEAMASQLHKCAADHDYTLGKMKNGLTPMDLQMIESGRIAL